jgi:hypothetical protein
MKKMSPRAKRAKIRLRRLKECTPRYTAQAYKDWLKVATPGEVRRHHRDWMGPFPQWAERETARVEK